MDVQLRTLLIEDCEDDATLVVRELTRNGFAVESRRVQTAAELTSALEAQEWDVVISDYAMPQFSGLDALAIVRAKFSDLPFILVSGAIGEAIAVTAMKAGANDYLLKDSLARLAPAVRRAIQEAHVRRAAQEELRRGHEQLENRIQERTAALAEANAKLVAEIAERKQIAEALRESEQRLNLALQASRTGIWDWDIVSNRNTWDATTCTIFGVPPDSFGGMFEDFVRRIHPEDRASVEQSVNRALTDRVTYESSFRTIDPEGNIRFITATGRAVYDEGGKPIRMAGVCLDTTERKRAQDELMIAKAAAEDANRAKSEFLANMSHEIRTPMTAIMGYADMLVDDALPQQDRLEAIRTIRRQSEHLLTIINDILDLSKIEAGKIEIEQLDCDPCQIAGDVTSLMRVRAIERGIRLELQFQGRVPQTIRTDPTRVRQILMNLVGNAIKFTDSGGVQIVVSLGQGASADQSMLRFEVIDSGVGMNAEQIGALFQPFKQGDSSTTRRFGGTGLGLTIARRLAQVLGGDIAVQSMPKLGSRFTFSLAVGDLTGISLCDGRESIRPEHSSADPRAAHQLHGRVLLAEDGPANQRVISYYLQQVGLEVTTVDNGRIAFESAIAAANAGKAFDVILMDMQMPELDGYGAAAKLRAAGYQGPIIALTAHAMSHDRRKCIDAGCSDYLSKPIERTKLLETLTRVLGERGEARNQSTNTCDDAAKTHLEQDDDIRQFLPMFLAELPEYARQIATATAGKNCEQVADVVHRIKGSGGMFGFTELSESAGRIEQAIETTHSFEAVAVEVEALLGLIRQIERYQNCNSNFIPRTRVA